MQVGSGPALDVLPPSDEVKREGKGRLLSVRGLAFTSSGPCLDDPSIDCALNDQCPAIWGRSVACRVRVLEAPRGRAASPAAGDEEKRLGVPVGMLNDRDVVNIPGSQHGFINFLVAPLVSPSAYSA